MKVFYNKQKAKIIQYRKYKDFSNEAFIFLKFYLGHLKALLITYFKNVKIENRYVRVNQASFLNSKIHKEIMRRTRLRNKFIDLNTDGDGISYNKQRNYCVSLIRKEKTNAFYSNLKIRGVTGNKTF